ncbi:MAG: PIN domain-containing protein [bacterium]|nr:PIN domain-containing protein [bacterium]
MQKIFIDSDVVLDVMLDREPHYPFSVQVFALLDIKAVKGHVSSLVFSNLYYVLRKVKASSIVIKALLQLRGMVDVIPVHQEIIDRALASDFKDFEDAIQYYAAMEKGLDLIITRNKKDYKKADVAVMTPEEFVASVA